MTMAGGEQKMTADSLNPMKKTLSMRQKTLMSMRQKTLIMRRKNMNRKTSTKR